MADGGNMHKDAPGMAKAARIDWLDRWKGVLIVLVVLGHATGSALHINRDPSSCGLLAHATKFIYLFHMPAFFCAAGCLWKRADGFSPRGFLDFSIRKALRLLVPYLIFGIASAIAYMLLADEFGKATSSSGYYSQYYLKSVSSDFLKLVAGLFTGTTLRCNSVLWFLPVMFMCVIAARMFDAVLSLLPRRARGAAGAVAVLACFALCSVPLRGVYNALPWPVSISLKYIPCFALGRAARGWISAIAQAPLPAAAAVSAAGTAAITGIVVWSPDFYSAVASDFWMAVFALFAVFGTAVSAAYAALFRFRAVSALGTASLGIMLMHKYPLMACCLKIPFLKSLCAGTPVRCAAGVVASTAVATAVSWIAAKAVIKIFPPALGGKFPAKSGAR